MKSPTQSIDVYNAVQPKAVLEYLRQNGWSKREDFSDQAQIWIHPAKHGDSVYEVLLPLTTDIPDYASRIDDVFRILQLAEQRPQTEIFNDLVDVSAIATDKCREILNMHFYFKLENSNASEEASAKHLGAILDSLQSLFDSLGQVKARRPSPFGKVAKDITDQTRLSVLGTFKGSFGLRLALAPKPKEEQLQLPNQSASDSLDEMVVQEFLEILNQTHEQALEQLSERLLSLQRRTASNYRKFLLALWDANTDLKVDWGSLNPNRGGTAGITSSDVIATVDAIKKIEAEAPQEYELVGELLTASKTNKSFEIRTMDNDVSLSGKIADEIVSSREIELTIGKLYNATIREKISVSPITGEGKIERTLVAIHPWHLDRTLAA